MVKLIFFSYPYTRYYPKHGPGNGLSIIDTHLNTPADELMRKKFVPVGKTFWLRTIEKFPTKLDPSTTRPSGGIAGFLTNQTIILFREKRYVFNFFKSIIGCFFFCPRDSSGGKEGANIKCGFDGSRFVLRRFTSVVGIHTRINFAFLRVKRK